MSRRFYTERELRYVRSWCAHRSPAWIAAKLGRSVGSIRTKISELGRKSGVPPGYVGIRESLVADRESTVVNLTRWYIRKARKDGVLHKADFGRAPYCVPEWWMDEQIDAKLTRAANTELARREGWYSIRDIAAATGLSPKGARAGILSAKTPLGRDMQRVMRIQGVRMTWYYEPQGTRLAIARYTGMRRAA